MTPLVIGSLVTTLVTGVISVIVAFIARSGAQNAARATAEAQEAASDAAKTKAAFEGLNATIVTLTNDQARLVKLVEHLRDKCDVLGRNDFKMRTLLRRTQPLEYDALHLEKVPNGF